MTFANWDESIHSELDQIAKIARASEIKTADITYSDDMQSAIISGTSTYQVTLYNCTCSSFVKTAGIKPCKHMYQLAIDNKLMAPPPTKDPQATKNFKITIPQEIERFKQLYNSGAISADKFVAIAKALQK